MQTTSSRLYVATFRPEDRAFIKLQQVCIDKGPVFNKQQQVCVDKGPVFGPKHCNVKSA